jgi:hypothetical protein
MSATITKAFFINIPSLKFKENCAACSSEVKTGSQNTLAANIKTSDQMLYYAPVPIIVQILCPPGASLRKTFVH